MPLDASPPDAVVLGRAPRPPRLLLARANRHGLVAGATGTGKTATLQVLAEGLSARGVPVFVSDVKGDLAGLARPGEPTAKLRERAEAVGLEGYAPTAFPVAFWDLFGEKGHPVRTTVSEMGPLLLARLMNLNEPQEGALNVAFRVADEEGMLLLDFKDLRAMLAHVGERERELTLQYGNVNRASVGAIQRQLLVLEEQGGAYFFGEPALDIRDFVRRDEDGRGVVNVLAADRLMEHPRLYATFLLWLLSELLEELPEVGDTERPTLVFFFDEAHLLFDDAPAALVDKVAQVVRLVRSKGVGVFFVTQNPLDLPDEVLGQLGNRVQHALRAFTPRDRKAVRSVAETFRANPGVDVANAITELGVGEALASFLDAKGAPVPVERALVAPPASRMGPVTAEERARILAASPLAGRYDETIDRDSAYEALARRAREAAADEAARAKHAPEPQGRGRGGAKRGAAAALGGTIARTLGREVTRGLVRGLLGSMRRR